MNITIIAVGKVKEKYLREGIDEYKKRLTRYCNLEIIEVSDEKTPDNASQREEEQIKAKEGAAILRHVKETSFVIALAINGKHLSSEELADQLSNLAINGNSNVVFIIGGSLGLSQEVLNRANYKLSFSKMTFPHQLMRMILVEQVYRGFRIINGEPYHK